MTYLMCLQCGWEGDDTELRAKTDNSEDKDFIYCPDCKSAEIAEFEDDEVKNDD